MLAVCQKPGGKNTNPAEFMPIVMQIEQVLATLMVADVLVDINDSLFNIELGVRESG